MKFISLGAEDLVPAVRYVSADIMVHNTGLEVIVERQLPALCPYFSGIRNRRTVTEYAWN